MTPSARTGAVAPVLALTFNAFVWGVSWWPFRRLEAAGLHPLWATAAIFTVVLAVLSVWRRGAWGVLARTPSLWLLVLAAGTTNAAFNWGVTVGDVVRVVLLFYLMPLWSALLAWALLGEKPGRVGGLLTAMSLAGAAIVLWPAGGGWPWPRTLAEALGVLGGFTFAFNNVWLRRQARHPEAARAIAMFLGGALVAGTGATVLSAAGTLPPPALPGGGSVALLLAMAGAFMASNLALQYGATRLAAGATAVVMLSEIVFASGSAVLLGAGTLDARLLAGGALILGAVVLSARH